jgi:PAS domain S-box-containing protein
MSELSRPLESTYNPTLVLLSVFVASLAALAALAVVDRIVVLKRRGDGHEQHWLFVGAVVMGGGVWGMHFTAMLAYQLPVKMSYSLAVTLSSMLPAMVGSWFALRFMSHERLDWVRLQVSGLLMAVGIGTMHYTGMEAMIIDAHMRYRFSLFVLSIVVAHILASTALYVRFFVSRRSGNRPGFRLLSAVVMGTAVAGMHYTAMAAVRFYPSPQQQAPDMLMPPGMMALIIAMVVVVSTALTVLGTVVDRRLTEASDKVLDAATRYNTVLATMADGFIVVGDDKTIETFNSAAEKIFGVESSQVMGRSFDDLIVVDGDRNVFDYYCESGDSYLIDLGSDVQGRRGNGDVFALELAISRMHIRGRDLFTCVVRDISERRALEVQLSHAQKLESIGQLAAGIAHEINTPTQYVGDNTRFLDDAFKDLLEPIRKISELFATDRENIEAEKAEDIRRAMEKADVDYLIEEIPQAIRQSLDGVGRVSKIVRAMKEFSHPAAEKSFIDVNRAIESTITVATNEWKYVAEVETDFDPELPQVPCLPGDFNQVILNIIVNAAHAIAEAKGDGDAEKGKIRVSTQRTDEWAEIKIRDDGPGIPRDLQKKIFDPFFTTKDVGKGTGQGLSIAHNTVVKRHGGSLSVESEPGEGACFTIRLPLKEITTSDLDVKVPA